jgi:hypothetical protein
VADPLPTLAEALEIEARELDGIERVETSEGIEWRLNGHAFASLAGRRTEFRLDPVVGAAALRTPDTGRSRRGEDWIAFEPGHPDGHALDRAVAWLASAYRRVAAGR